MWKNINAAMLALLGWLMLMPVPALAGSSGLYPATLPKVAAGLPAPNVYRVDSTNLETTNYFPTAGGAGYSTTTRVRVFSQNAIPAGTTMIVIVPLFYTSYTGVNEADLPSAYDFTGALEYPYYAGTTNIPTNTRYQLVPSSGGSVFHYTVGGYPYAYTTFRVLVPVTIPARTAYGLWLTHENVAGRTAAVSNVAIYRGSQGANVIQKYEGAVSTSLRAASLSSIGSGNGTYATATFASAPGFPTGSIVTVSGTTNWNGTYVVYGNGNGGLNIYLTTANKSAAESSGTVDPGHIAADAPMNLTSITPYTSTTHAASTAFMTPAAVLIPMSASSVSIAIVGNSKEDGNYEGTVVSTSPDGVVHGDVSGDQWGNRGAARLAWLLGAAVGQNSRGTDRDAYRLLVPSFTGSISGGVLTVSAVNAGIAAPGMKFTVGGITTTILSNGTGTGGTGTYNLDNSSISAASGTVFTVLQGNYSRRLQVLAAENPTAVIGMNPTNELVSTTSAGAWAASATVALDTVVYSGSNYYIAGALNDNWSTCTTGATGPTGTTANTPYSDGGCTWYYIGPRDMGTGANSGDMGANWVGVRRKRERMDHAVVPLARFFGVTQTPLTNSYNESITSSNYSYNSTSGALSFTVSGAAHFNNNAYVHVTGLTPSTLNVFGQATVSGSTVTVTAPTGLAAPTGTALLYNQFQDASGQSIQTAYVASAAPQSSMRSWINRFLRNTSLSSGVLGYYGIIDMAKWEESGNPTTPAAETGVWAVVNDTSGVPTPLTNEGGHEEGFGYDYTYGKIIANDTGLTSTMIALPR